MLRDICLKKATFVKNKIKERIYQAINFIENNLQKDISIKDIAFHSCYSIGHFQRLFRQQVGLTVKEYIRKRRLIKAALELCISDKRVIDIAYDYQFKYEQSFIRAFKKEFLITPAKLKRKIINSPLQKNVLPEILQLKQDIKSVIHNKIKQLRDLHLLELEDE